MSAPGWRQLGALKRAGESLTRSSGQIDAQDLRDATTTHGTSRIDSLADRQVATVSRAIRAVTLRPKTNVPALVVEVYDGSQTLNLVWLGRRQIRGIEPGVYLKATGRVCRSDGERTIFNPSYELLPRRGN